MIDDADVTASLHAVMRDIADAARRAGRDPASVKLIAVKSLHLRFLAATRSSARLSMLTSLAMLKRSTCSLLS